MFCTHCGENNPDQAALCRRCGTQLEKPAGFPSVDSSNVLLPSSPSQVRPVSSEQLSFEAIPGIPATPQSPQQFSFEQFSFSEPGTLPVQSTFPGSPPFQAQPTPFGLGYPSGGLQSPGSPAAYTSPYQQGFANQGSEALLDTQLQIPDQNMYASAPGAPPPPVIHQPEVRTIAKPLPTWIFVLSIVVVIAIFAALFFTGSDWAAGTMHIGFIGGILAIIILLATIVRTLAGMAARSNPKRRIQFISTGLLVLILLLVSGISLTQQASIHQVQGRFLEGQQQWQSAINEFQMAGEHAPNSDNIARTYDEWGEQLSNVQHYDTSIDKFGTVLDTYSLATGDVTRAQADNVAAYLNWGKQATQQHDYSDATTHFNDLLNLPYCNANCQAEANALDATAYYDMAELQLTSQQYASAANTFQTLVTLFPKSPEVRKDHEDYARALFGEGKQELTSTCSSAIPIYQQLSSQFGDTPEGQQASTALKAPQEVKGRFITSVPKSSALTPMAVLAQGLFANISQSQFFQLIAGAPTVVIKSDGSFTFKPVKQGKYDLAWGTNNTDGSSYFYFSYQQSNKSLIYVANVGPLCPFDFGNIDEPIPVAP